MRPLAFARLFEFLERAVERLEHRLPLALAVDFDLTHMKHIGDVRNQRDIDFAAKFVFLFELCDAGNKLTDQALRPSRVCALAPWPHSG